MKWPMINTIYNVSGALIALGALGALALILATLDIGRWTEVLTWAAAASAFCLLAGGLGWEWAGRRHTEYLDREYPYRNHPECWEQEPML